MLRVCQPMAPAPVRASLGRPRHARRPARSAAVGVVLLMVLTSCSGRGNEPGPPDYGTPAPETPGPLTAAEQQYIQTVPATMHQLLALEFRLSTILAESTPTPDQHSRAQAVLTEMTRTLQTAEAIQPPLRLQAIDLHYRAALTYYRTAVAWYTRDVAGLEPRPVEQEVTAITYAHGAAEQTRTLLEGFMKRHP